MRQYTYVEMTKIIKRNGYTYVRSTGDHFVYKRDGKDTIVLVKKKHINPCIARRLIKENNLIID